MFCDYCHFIDDAWWQYYHNENYVLWQENVDRLIAAMRKRIAAQEQLTFVSNVWADADFILDV